MLSATTVKLLQAASQILGGDKALADRLGITETLLAKFKDDIIELPDRLLLEAADVVLAERQSRLPRAGRPVGPADEESLRDR